MALRIEADRAAYISDLHRAKMAALKSTMPLWYENEKIADVMERRARLLDVRVLDGIARSTGCSGVELKVLKRSAKDECDQLEEDASQLRRLRQ